MYISDFVSHCTIYLSHTGPCIFPCTIHLSHTSLCKLPLLFHSILNKYVSVNFVNEIKRHEHTCEVQYSIAVRATAKYSRIIHMHGLFVLQWNCECSWVLSKRTEMVRTKMHIYECRGDSRFLPSHWETAFLCSDVSHWLSRSLESALILGLRPANERRRFFVTTSLTVHKPRISPNVYNTFVCTLHHLIIIIVQTLSEDIELIKCLSDIICRVCKIKHILSVIHYTICGAVFFQFTYFLRDDWENIHTLSYYHHQIGSMNYYPLFRVRSWNNGMRCMYFYILIHSCITLARKMASSPSLSKLTRHEMWKQVYINTHYFIV